MQNLALVEKVDGLAKSKGIKPGQLALAWVHAQVSQGSLLALPAHMLIVLTDLACT